jgi:hypothetical protein
VAAFASYITTEIASLTLVVCGEQINHYPARRGRA